MRLSQDRIFHLYLEDYGPTQIARLLKKNRRRPNGEIIFDSLKGALCPFFLCSVCFAVVVGGETGVFFE